jgi:hypothetical protein
MARITDGHRTLISFQLAPSLKIWQVDVTPPGLDAGGANDVTVMENLRYRTFMPKHLVTLTEAGATVQYDPIFYNDLVEMIGINQLCFVTFPDGSSVEFWGWLDKITPNAAKEGEPPTATMRVIPSNMDDTTDPFEEVAPLYLPG